MIGERLKHVFTGYGAWILSYKDECFDRIGLRPKHKIKLRNGDLECEYRCYELFAGTNKAYKKAEGERKKAAPRVIAEKQNRKEMASSNYRKGKTDRKRPSSSYPKRYRNVSIVKIEKRHQPKT